MCKEYFSLYFKYYELIKITLINIVETFFWKIRINVSFKVICKLNRFANNFQMDADTGNVEFLQIGKRKFMENMKIFS